MDTLFDKQISKLYLGNKFDQDLREKMGETRFPFHYGFYCIQKYLLFTKFIIIILPQFVRRRVNLDMKQIIFTRFRCQHTFFIGWQLGLGQTFITVVFLNIWWIVTKIFWNNSKMSPLPGLIEVLSFLSDKYPAWQSVAYRQRWLKQTSHQNAETKKYQLYTFVTTNATVAQYSRKLLGNFFETTCRIPYF